MLVNFFFELRKGGVPVTITEFLTLLKALRAVSPGLRPRISTISRAPRS